jgi:hypothetical protein
MKKLFVLLLVSSSLSSGTEECSIISLKGKIEIRQPYQEAWNVASVGEALKDRVTIRSHDLASAKIKTFDGSIFYLPPSAQIEIRNLMKLDRNQVIMELTVLDMQKLPRRNDPATNETALILHGSSKEDRDMDFDQKYITMEMNGAMALFDQDYLPGFVIKWNQLKSAFPHVISEKAEKALMEAYQKLGMEKRRKDMMKSSDSSDVNRNME